MKKLFSVSVKRYLRMSGHTQQELAATLGLHAKVLSRKLNGTGGAYLNTQDIRNIIVTLARWRVVTSKEEVQQLLEAAELASTIFTAREWQLPPLGELDAAQTPSARTLSPPSSPLRHNLSTSTTQLIGREWAIEYVRKLLLRDDVRLVTLSGVGGSGKTRLALQVAREETLLEAFPDGIWFVALAGINDPALVPMNILDALNVQSLPPLSPLQSLKNYLQNKRLLLILDNFEQLSNDTATISELLATTSCVKILVTSRVVLHVYGEREFLVPPLDIPAPSAPLKPPELLRYSAVQLFVERAQAVRSIFAVTESNAGDIAQICARLDGLPLALELAAARIKVLSPAQLRERLSISPFSLLVSGTRDVPERHKALYSTMQWSYSLLSGDEQAWFRRLAVFSGGCSLEAAEALMQHVTAGQDDIPVVDMPLDMLTRLVDNNLLVYRADENEQGRFSMLETLREYALERLKAQGEYVLMCDWHACYYLKEAEEGELGLRGPQQMAWLRRLERERDNFRAALEWALQRAREGESVQVLPSFARAVAHGKEVAGSKILSRHGFPVTGICSLELALRLAAALRHFWEWQGNMNEARHWLDAVLAQPYQGQVGKTQQIARAKALSEYARLVLLQNDQERAVRLADESIALWQQLDEADGLAMALLHRGWVALAETDFATAKAVFLEGIELVASSNPWLHAQLLFHLASAEGFTGVFERMHVCYDGARKLFEQVGDACARADLLKDWGGMMLLEAEFLKAFDMLWQSLLLCRQLGNRQFIASGLGLLSFAVGLLPQLAPEQASLNSAYLGGAAESLMERIGFVPWTKSNDFIKAVRAFIRSRVTEDCWTEAWATGRAMTVEQALELAKHLRETISEGEVE